MKLADFSIGREFTCGDRRWRCTDIGTRVVVAIGLDDYPDDPSWYNGPPYAVNESAFDEYDQEACEPIEREEGRLGKTPPLGVLSRGRMVRLHGFIKDARKIRDSRLDLAPRTLKTSGRKSDWLFAR